MVRILLVVALVFSGISLLGCGKKAEPVDEYQEAMSLEEVTPASGASVTAQEAKPVAQVTPATSAAALEPLPPAGPYKPTPSEIQTALKNAGFYIGEVDGKLGPMSEKAIKDFQSANGLEPDGKVGPKTWAAMSKHLKK